MIVKVAVVQDTPVFFDKEKTLAKVETIVKQQAKDGYNLIVFPESFVPGYPRGFSFGAIIGSRTDQGRQHYADYYNNSFDLESDDLTRLETLAKKQNIYIVNITKVLRVKLQNQLIKICKNYLKYLKPMTTIT